jgi:hypothetical protein
MLCVCVGAPGYHEGNGGFEHDAVGIDDGLPCKQEAKAEELDNPVPPAAPLDVANEDPEPELKYY